MRTTVSRALCVLSCLVLLPLTGCADSAPPPVAASTGESGEESGPVSVLDVDAESFTGPISRARQSWSGDLDDMVERRLIRALVVANQTQYFLDRATQRGITYDGLKLFEEQINKQFKTGNLKTHILIIPVTRDQILPDLVAGRGDIAATNLTITPGRQGQADFTDPLATGVAEIIVTGPNAPSLSSLDDLAGQEVFVRRSSSYYDSLVALNKSFKDRGKPEVGIKLAEERLETEDILEMVNAGLVPITVADSYLAEFWDQIFDDITLHRDLAVRSGGQIAWAVRKKSPQLLAALNAFVKEHRQGTLMGNILIKRYLKSTKWVKNAHADADRERFRNLAGLFQEYASQYDFDWLMIAAQGYQESGLDQSVRSSAGAIGVMQLLKSTAADPNVNIPEIEELEKNIHAGNKYLRFIVDHYFADEDLDDFNKALFAFASYNAGPNRIARLRREAKEAGLDPNVWFDNVEIIAARRIGRETVQYVSNILKYYAAYTLLEHREEMTEATKR